MSDEKLDSSKIKVLLKLIESIWEKFPGEKIITFSKSLHFLNLLTQAMSRRKSFRRNNVAPFRFDGTVSDSERDEVKKEFSKDANQYNPILVTGGAAGAAVNLDAASHVIIAEPWWVKNEELQAIGRAFRLGQDRVVHAYLLQASNSIIDKFMV
jgi:SNF2 family DNA or RNA helicase